MSTRADSLQDGSWNGVAFKYLDAAWNPGLRGQLHEYADSDRGYFEPLGQRTAQFTLDIFLIGDDWIAARQELLKAFASGTGTLVHPTDGRLAAICVDIQAKETVTAMGRADMSVTFLPGNKPLAPAARDTGSDVDTAAAAASSASEVNFSSGFDYVGQTFEVRNATETTLGDALDTIGGAVGFVSGIVGNVIGFASSVIGGASAWFNYAISAAGLVVRTVLNDVSAVTGFNASVEQQSVSWAADLASTASSVNILGGYPAVGAQLASLVSGISGLRPTGSGDPFISWSQQRRTGISRVVMRSTSPTSASASLSPVTIGGYSKATIQAVFTQHLALAVAATRPVSIPGAAPQTGANANAVFDVVRQAALIEAAGAFSAMPFSSRNEALATRDRIADAIDDECNLVSGGPLRQALQTLRIAVVADARARSASLPQVTTITLPATVSATVLANRLYDDPGMAADMVARNNVENPQFMPAGVPLEVLVNG